MNSFVYTGSADFKKLGNLSAGMPFFEMGKCIKWVISIRSYLYLGWFYLHEVRLLSFFNEEMLL